MRRENGGGKKSGRNSRKARYPRRESEAESGRGGQPPPPRKTRDLDGRWSLGREGRPFFPFPGTETGRRALTGRDRGRPVVLGGGKGSGDSARRGDSWAAAPRTGTWRVPSPPPFRSTPDKKNPALIPK